MSRQTDFAATACTQISEYATSLSAHFADLFPGEHLIIASPQATIITTPVEVAPTVETDDTREPELAAEISDDTRV